MLKKIILGVMVAALLIGSEGLLARGKNVEAGTKQKQMKKPKGQVKQKQQGLRSARKQPGQQEFNRCFNALAKAYRENDREKMGQMLRKMNQFRQKQQKAKVVPGKRGRDLPKRRVPDKGRPGRFRGDLGKRRSGFGHRGIGRQDRGLRRRGMGGGDPGFGHRGMRGWSQGRGLRRRGMDRGGPGFGHRGMRGRGQGLHRRCMGRQGPAMSHRGMGRGGPGFRHRGMMGQGRDFWRRGRGGQGLRGRAGRGGQGSRGRGGQGMLRRGMNVPRRDNAAKEDFDWNW